VPAAAEHLDGFTNEGWRVVWDCAGHQRFPLDAALAALRRDRAAVATFEAREPRAAREIRDYLDLWLSDLDLIERTARDLAAAREQGWQRKHPSHISTSRKYGDSDGPTAA
jgi:hypothetical protein